MGNFALCPRMKWILFIFYILENIEFDTSKIVLPSISNKFLACFVKLPNWNLLQHKEYNIYFIRCSTIYKYCLSSKIFKINITAAYVTLLFHQVYYSLWVFFFYVCKIFTWKFLSKIGFTSPGAEFICLFLKF